MFNLVIGIVIGSLFAISIIEYVMYKLINDRLNSVIDVVNGHTATLDSVQASIYDLSQKRTRLYEQEDIRS